MTVSRVNVRLAAPELISSLCAIRICPDRHGHPYRHNFERKGLKCLRFASLRSATIHLRARTNAYAAHWTTTVAYVNMSDSGEPRRGLVIKVRTQDVIQVAAFPTGERIATFDENGVLRVYDTKDGTLFRSTWKKSVSARTFAVLDADTILISSENGRMYLWCLQSHSLIRANDISGVSSCLSLGNGLFVVGTGDGALFVMKREGDQIYHLRREDNAHEKGIWAMAAGEGRFATVSYGEVTKLWDSETLACISTRMHHDYPVSAVSVGNSMIVTGSRLGTVHTYDAETFTRTRTIAAHNGMVRTVHFIDNEEAVLSASTGQTVAVHDIRCGSCRWRVNMDVPIISAALLPDGRIAAALDHGGPTDCLEIFSAPAAKESEQSKARSSKRKRPGSFNETARSVFKDATKNGDSCTLGLGKVHADMNKLLEQHEGLSTVSRQHLEDMFVELADEDDYEVTEEVFVNIFNKIRKEQRIGALKKRFRRAAEPEMYLSLRIAARILRSFCKEVGSNGDAAQMENFDVEERLREVAAGETEDVEEQELLSAAENLMSS